jgi:hypothetical protein
MEKEKVICEECLKAGLKSRVYVLGCMKTAMYCRPYYDEEGNFHHHDSNVVTEMFKCSNGHEWQKRSGGSCWCGWKWKGSF